MGILSKIGFGKKSSGVNAASPKKEVVPSDFKSSKESSISSAQLVVALRSSGKVSTREEFVPKGFVIRNTISLEYGILENMLSHLAVVSYGNLSVGILVSDKYVGEKHHVDLRDKILDKGLKIISERISEVSLILDVNGAINDRGDKNSSDVSVLVEEITAAAFKEGATDIHICCRENTGMILFRVHSKIWKYKRFPSLVCLQIAGYLYTAMAEETSRSQPSFQKEAKSLSCMIRTVYQNSSYKLRYKFIGMADGWDVIMRVLKVESPDEKKLTFTDLGYEASQVKEIELAVSRSIGLVAITGPTGSGKSTTLKTMMEFDPNRHLKKRYSIEDPVEYKIYGVSQIPIQRNDHEVDGSNASFTGVLRDILRADPDDVMVGETRDKSTAAMLADAVLTGHKMYTTLHTASAVGAYLRLNRLGLDRHILADRQFVAVMVFQRLMPVICENCKLNAMEHGLLTPMQIHHLSNRFRLNLDSIYLANPQGCECCKNGYKGSTVVAEVLTPDAQLRGYIANGRDDEAEQYFRKSRKSGFDDPDMTGKTAYEHALYKMSRGIIDPNDIESELGPFETHEVIYIEN